MIIHVTVKTRARRGSVERTDETRFTVSIREQPIDGKANNAVRNLLAEYFSVAPSQVVLKKGRTSRHKIFEVFVQS